MSHGPPAKRNNNGTNNGITNDSDDEIQLPIPPDGGWGWVVVFASFMIHIVTDGITYSFGIFYVEFLNYFNEGKGYTAWIASILVGVTLCSGPISSSFVNRYGCRPVTIAGAILASVCMVISMFAQNVLILIFTIGIGAGFGFGLIYLPAIVSVTMYFEKYRSLATGIAVCGSGLGTFIFAPLTESLIGQFGWRGTCLILAAIVLHCIIFGAMFRPLEPTPKRLSSSASSTHTLNRKITEHSNMTEMQPLQHNGNLSIPIDTKIARSQSIGHSMVHSHQMHNGHTNRKKSVDMNNVDKKNLMRATVSQPHINVDGSHFSRSFKDVRDKSGSGTMYRPDILYQGSLLNIAEYRSRGDSISGKKSELTHYGSFRRDRRQSTDKKINHLCGCIPCSKETCDTFNEMMDFSLFSDIIFIIFTLSNFCTSIGFNIPYVYLAAQADALGLSKEEASYLLSTIGIANTVGRIILGYLSDKTWVNRLLVYNVSLTLCGIATALSIFCLSFNTLLIYASVFGFTIGAYVGLTSVILVDLLGLDKLTNAFGLLLLFQGIASLVGPPFAGWLYDILGSYNPGFLLAGGTIAISGVMLFLIPPIQNHRKKLTKNINNGNAVEVSMS